MKNKTKNRILLVDDEKSLCSMLEMNLARKGFDVKVVHSGEECLNILKDYTPDVIILDVLLPKLSGFEVCARIRVDHSLKIPIIIHTALTDAINENISKICKADAYIAKPQGLEQLENTINRFLA